MDILKPPLMWIGNRCYRRTLFNEKAGFNPEDEELYDDDDDEKAYCDDEACDVDFDIQETKNGYQTVMKVPSAYYKYIIGKKGDTKRRIETETKTQILVPKPNDPKEEIVIKCFDKKGLMSAKTRLDVLIDSARQKQQFTHFLSIPVNAEEVVVGFDDFKFDVLRQCDGDRGLNASLFQNPQKLHLTIGTFVLLNDDEKQTAIDAIQECMKEIVEPLLEGGGLCVTVHGLEYMNDDPGAVDVLYARLLDDCQADMLQSLCDRVVDRLTGRGIMQRDYERVKLHATVLNTLFRRDEADERPKERESFDASGILKRFGERRFGPLPIPCLHLSTRFSSGPDGYYAAAATFPLPGALPKACPPKS